MKIDKTFAKHLERFKNPSLQVIAKDFRAVEIESLCTKKKVKIVANIPYHLTGLILQSLLPKREIIESIHLMVQKEVAERCTAKVGTKHYSSFTLFVNYHAWARLLFSISKRSFYPQPKVDSALLQLDLKASPISLPYDRFFKLIRTAFQKRRKMLRSSLKEGGISSSDIEIALEKMGRSKESRPQELTLLDFATLFHSLYQKEKEIDTCGS